MELVAMSVPKAKPTAAFRPRSTARIFSALCQEAERAGWPQAQLDARLAAEGILDPAWSRRRRAAALAAAAALLISEEAA